MRNCDSRAQLARLPERDVDQPPCGLDILCRHKILTVPRVYRANVKTTPPRQTRGGSGVLTYRIANAYMERALRQKCSARPA